MPQTIRTSADPLLDFIEERIGFGTWEWKLSDHSLRWSKGMHAILGLDPRSTAASFGLYNNIVHPADRLDFTNTDQILASGRLADRRFRIIRPSGEMRWLRSCGQALYDAEGSPVRFIGFALDITEMREQGRELEMLKSIYHAVEQVFDLTIWRTGPYGTPLFDAPWPAKTNARPLALDDAIERVHPEDRAAVRALWKKAMEEQTPCQAQFRVHNPDGSEETLTSSAVPMRGADGNVSGWVGFHTDSRPAQFGGAWLPLEEDAIDSTQIRAARACLDWTINELADKSGVSFSTIRRIENEGISGARPSSVEALRRCLTQAGVTFVTTPSGRKGVVI